MVELSEKERAFIEKNRGYEIRKLALQMDNGRMERPSFVLDQIAGWQTAVEKLPSWAACPDVLYPAHLSMEQCSSEATAAYKAQLISSTGDMNSLVDLTAGFGVDFTIIARLFKESTFVERQKELSGIVSHNLPLLGIKNAKAIHGDGMEYLENMNPVDWVFIDPARRNEHGGKCVAISDCEPDITRWASVLRMKSKHTLVKLSPMLDISMVIKELDGISQVHVVSVDNECKELLLVVDGTKKEPVLSTVNLIGKESQIFQFTQSSEADSPCRFCDELSEYLYEPNASLLKAGAFRSLSSHFHIEKLHPNSHLYTSSVLNKDFPGRIFHIESFCHFGKKEMKAGLSGIEKANIAIRNFPLSVQEIRKRTKISDGGEWYLFATTLKQEEKVLIKCKKA